MVVERKMQAPEGGQEDGSSSRYMTVAIPLPHEGVGRALRASYAPARNNVPTDMLDLLARLN